MRFVIQVADEASVTVDNEITGQIGKGLAVLVGIGPEDTEEIADKMIKKLIGIRIFEDENGKTNLSIMDVRGSLLIVSQFTLYADCSHGNRPNFLGAAKPQLAESLYEYIIRECKKTVPGVETGIFGAAMKLKLINDGPFTIVLDSGDLK